jgi:hypothetical protein
MKNLAWVTALSHPSVLGHCFFVTLDISQHWVTRLFFSWVTVPLFFLPSPGVTDLPSSLFSYGHYSLIALNYPRSRLFLSTLISWVTGLYFLFPHRSLSPLSSPVLGHCPSCRRSLLAASPLLAGSFHSTSSLLSLVPALSFALLSWFTLSPSFACPGSLLFLSRVTALCLHSPIVRHSPLLPTSCPSYFRLPCVFYRGSLLSLSPPPVMSHYLSFPLFLSRRSLVSLSFLPFSRSPSCRGSLSSPVLCNTYLSPLLSCVIALSHTLDLSVIVIMISSPVSPPGDCPIRLF